MGLHNIDGAYGDSRGQELIEDDREDKARYLLNLDKARERADMLEQVVDACEAANLKHLQHIDKLEDLCRDLWEFSNVTGSGGAEKAFKERMEELGLLDEPNERLMDTFFKDAQGRTPVEQLEALTEACRKQVDND